MYVKHFYLTMSVARYILHKDRILCRYRGWYIQHHAMRQDNMIAQIDRRRSNKRNPEYILIIRYRLWVNFRVFFDGSAFD